MFVLFFKTFLGAFLHLVDSGVVKIYRKVGRDEGKETQQKVAGQT